MTESTIRPIVEAFYKASAARDIETALSFIADYVDWLVQGPVDLFAFLGQRRGKAAVREGYGEIARKLQITGYEIKTLLVGYSADVEIVLETKPDVLRIPTQALLEGNRLLVQRPDGKIEERTITPGLSNWQFTEVVSGLSANEKFVVSLERTGVKAGARVKSDKAAPGKGK